ncbi:MAG: hypothetical protein GXX08_07625 [Firmicutes bacterium]|nr:hypothetical protein [Bacillota bacterium]
MSIDIGICGEGRPDPRMEGETGHELIRRLCEGPVDIESIEPELLEAFRKMNAIRTDGSQCFLNFTCFLKKDIEHLNDICDGLGRDLARAVARCLGDRSHDVTFGEVEREKYLFFLVGCVSLDWHGLKTLKRLGLTLGPDEMEKPGYGRFTLFANERVQGNVKELYWGSHNSTHGDYVFTTFGDHDSMRVSFPDLIWHLRAVSRLEIAESILCDMTDNYLQEVGDLLKSREFAHSTTTRILRELHFIKDDRLNIPVITVHDMASVKPVIDAVDKAVGTWLREHSDELRHVFADVTPVRVGVDFREVLIQLWHYIFGHTNKHLCRMGALFNPYSESSDWPGYLPVVWEKGCDLS